MATILFSLPAHESNDTVRDTIANVRKFNGYDHPIMIHADANWHSFDASIANNDANVWMNPQRWPTQHAHCQIPTHVSNFQQAVRLGLPFTHMAILHTSELFVRPGLSQHIAPYDHSLWFTPDTQPQDPSWPPMQQTRRIWPKFSNYLGNLIEGSWYSKDMFSEICRFVTNHYDLAQMVLPYALEESLFPTLSWHLSGGQRYTHPYCAFKHDQHFLGGTGFIDDIRNGNPVTFWQPHNFTYAYAPFPSQGLYSVKRIARNVDDKIRSYVRLL